MKLIKILFLFTASMFFLTSCDLEEQTFTFVSGDDVAASGSYDQLVSGAYLTLLFPFEWGNYAELVNFDCDYQTGPGWAFGSITLSLLMSGGLPGRAGQTPSCRLPVARFNTVLQFRLKYPTLPQASQSPLSTLSTSPHLRATRHHPHPQRSSDLRRGLQGRDTHRRSAVGALPKTWSHTRGSDMILLVQSWIHRSAPTINHPFHERVEKVQRRERTR